MSFLTRYGTVYGDIPQQFGRIFYVSPATTYYIDGKQCTASDSANDGLAPDRALATISRALVLAAISQRDGSAISNTGEVIMLLPGTHTVTATINVSLAGVTIWGVSSDESSFPRFGRGRTIVTSTGTNDELFNITASNVELGFFTLRPTSGFSAVSFQTTSAIDNLYLHDLVFDMMTPEASLDTRGLDFGNRAGGTGIARTLIGSTVAGNVYGTATCYAERLLFLERGAQGEAVHVATCHFHIKDSRLHNVAGTWASAFIVATGSLGLLENVLFTRNGTISAQLVGFAGNSTANSIAVINCRFDGATADIVGLTSVANAVTSYEPTSGGTLSVAN